MFMRKRNDHFLNKICLIYVFFPSRGRGGVGAGGRRRVLGKLFIGAWGKTRNQGKKFDFKEATSMRWLQSQLFF
jgi:hypothetical protein